MWWVWRKGRVGCHPLSSGIESIICENIAKTKKVNNKKKGTLDRALGHTATEWGRLGLKRLKMNKVRVISEIRGGVGRCSL